LPVEAEEQFHYILTQTQKNPYYESNEAYFNILATLLASCAGQKVNARGNALLDHIYAFVRSHFSDPSLSISAIAQNLDMAENYISTFFKQNTGENLSAYIEDTRMDAAIDYITAGKMSMKEISEKVGYANINTFYKAFKRRYGVPPKRYQQNLEMGERQHAVPPI
jgi:YesN/AraC family two-component response regulator